MPDLDDTDRWLLHDLATHTPHGRALPTDLPLAWRALERARMVAITTAGVMLTPRGLAEERSTSRSRRA